MKYAVMVAAMLGALGAGAYAQGDNNMGGTSPPDQETLPDQQQQQQAPLPDQAPDQSMSSDTDMSTDQAQGTDQTQSTDQAQRSDQTKSADQAKGTEKTKGTEKSTEQAKNEPAQPETITDQNGKTVASTDVLFAFDSSQLKADADSELKPIADWAKCNPKGAVIIEGHADPRGTVDYNQKLSARRAAQVRERLVALGVPSARIVMSVYGKQGPRRATFAEDRRATVRPALTPVEAREVTAQR
jgi:peptidoglycan-associated lipoprotein